MSKESSVVYNIDNQSLSIPEIHQRIKESYLGFTLSYEQVRWNRNRPWQDPIPENNIDNNVSQYEWQSPLLIGRDANNLGHCYLTFQQSISFLERQKNSNSPIKLTPEEEEMIYIISEFHDIGEALTGDKNWELKTKEDEKKELIALKRAIPVIIGNELQAKELANQIGFYLFSQEGLKTKVGYIFNIIERLGYFETAMRAWQKAPEFSQTNPILSIKLQLLTNNVLLNNLTGLIQDSNNYPGVKITLLNNKHWINQAFAMKQSVMDQYDQPHRIPEYKEKFAAAKAAWYQWTRNPDNAKI